MYLVQIGLNLKLKNPLSDYKISPHIQIKNHEVLISVTMKLQRQGPIFSYFYIYFYNPDITGILTLLSMTNMESLYNVQVAQIYWHGHGRDLYTSIDIVYRSLAIASGVDPTDNHINQENYLQRIILTRHDLVASNEEVFRSNGP